MLLSCKLRFFYNTNDGNDNYEIVKKDHNMSMIKAIVMVIDNAYGNFILMRTSMRGIMINIIM